MRGITLFILAAWPKWRMKPPARGPVFSWPSPDRLVSLGIRDRVVASWRRCRESSGGSALWWAAGVFASINIILVPSI